MTYFIKRSDGFILPGAYSLEEAYHILKMLRYHIQHRWFSYELIHAKQRAPDQGA